MSLFDEEPADSSVAEIEYPKESGRSPMVMLPLLALAAVLVALVLFFAGRWIYRTISNDSPPAPSTSESNSAGQGTTNQNPPASTPTPAPQPSTPAPNPRTGSNLPNSGPGEVIALFLTVTAVAAGLHYIVALRRHNHSY